MPTIFRNARLFQLDPPSVRLADLAVIGGVITDIRDIAATDAAQPPSARTSDSAASAEIVECAGRVVMPGLVVGHHHLYSALAVGMPPPSATPRDFVEILELIWWKLDRALDDETVYLSALAGAARAALSGVTTIVDHHASPTAIAGSLDHVVRGLSEVGVRGVLCYEITDRNGPDGTRAGLAENDRFLAWCRDHGVGRFAGMVGGHASFTMSDATLAATAELVDAHGAGVHIHVAEDLADEAHCRENFAGEGLVARLERHRIVRDGSLFAHCTHLTPADIARLHAGGATIAHNTRSNMHNAVGYAPIAAMAAGPLVLGTDGMDGDLFAESRTAWFKSLDARAGLPFAAPMGWVAGSARFAGARLGLPALGRLEVGAPADFAVLDYDLPHPMDDTNAAGHWTYGFEARHVTDVMRGGQWTVRGRKLVDASIAQRLHAAGPAIAALWKRFRNL